MPRPLVFIHGYSAAGNAFFPVRDALMAKRPDLSIADVNICTYISLNNEVTITDIAEGLDRALRNLSALAGEQEFDAIVHSTGMLVIRTWLANQGMLASRNPRLKRLKHLIGLAPATWGSPQASKGRTWLGALIKGPKNWGPDFMNAGDLVLDGLELGSAFTWQLAHWDLLGPEPYYDQSPHTPFVSVFIGNQGYGGLSSLADSPGADGTVRWSGCALTTRKFTLDLTRIPVVDEDTVAGNPRISIDPRQGSIEIPMIAVSGRCHSTLISDPEPGMIDLIVDFLAITAPDPEQPAPAQTAYDAWLARAQAYGKKGLAQMLLGSTAKPGLLHEVEQKADALLGHPPAHPDAAIDGWQQFILHVVDSHGQGVSDYFLELETEDARGAPLQLQDVFEDVHAYQTDNSYRCFHVKLPLGVSRGVPKLTVRLHASTGTRIVSYQGYGDPTAASPQMTEDTPPVSLDLSALAAEAGAFFAPFRTTLIEIQINREPMPLTGENQVLFFV